MVTKKKKSFPVIFEPPCIKVNGGTSFFFGWLVTHVFPARVRKMQNELVTRQSRGFSHHYSHWSAMQ